jgi:hypothetical protein
MLNIFDYVIDGKIGVKRRFGEAITKSLEKMPGDVAVCLPDFVDIDWKILVGIIRKEYDWINRDVIEKLADALDLNIKECIGEFINLTPNVEEQWSKELSEKGFVAIEGNNGSAGASKSSLIRLFMIFRTLDNL